MSVLELGGEVNQMNIPSRMFPVGFHSTQAVSLLLAVSFALGISVILSGCAAGPAKANQTDEICVVDLVIASPDRIIAGTNVMTVAQATNFLAGIHGEVDAAVLHGSLQGKPSVLQNGEVLSRILDAGVPMLIVEPDGEASWRAGASKGKVRTVTIDTDKLSALMQNRNKGSATKNQQTGFVGEAKIRWDHETGEYDLYQVEAGVLGRKVWVVHERTREDAESDSVSVRFKKKF